MWKTVQIYLGCCAGIVVLSIGLVVVIVWVYYYVPHGVLPSRYAMTHMPETELEAVVLKTTPVGTTRKDVETALNETFRREWQREDVVVEYASQGGFHVPLSDGDYYFRSKFAVNFDLFSRVARVHFLFGRDDKLKDVYVLTYQDGP